MIYQTNTKEHVRVKNFSFTTRENLKTCVLFFATRKNLELLARSEIWFMDGTFKVAFLSSKETTQYEIVLKAIQDAAKEFRIRNCIPSKIISDFEKAIINACDHVFPDVPLVGCFFHLSQNLRRKMNKTGVEELYRDPKNEKLRTDIHMILALSYVPVEDVRQVYRQLRREVSPKILPVLDYFGETYVIGVPAKRRKKAKGRKKASAPTYDPKVWNQFNAALDGSHRTNNISEGWHNRFRIVVGKRHPGLYSAIIELQKEQDDTETIVSEFDLGRRVKASPVRKWIDLEERLKGIAKEYADYESDGKEM